MVLGLSPKQMITRIPFAGSNISLEVLFSSLNDFLQVLREERKGLHIPTIVEALQQQQIESICEQARSRYEEYLNQTILSFPYQVASCVSVRLFFTRLYYKRADLPVV